MVYLPFTNTIITIVSYKSTVGSYDCQLLVMMIDNWVLHNFLVIPSGNQSIGIIFMIFNYLESCVLWIWFNVNEYIYMLVCLSLTGWFGLHLVLSLVRKWLINCYQPSLIELTMTYLGFSSGKLTKKRSEVIIHLCDGGASDNVVEYKHEID